MNTLAEVQIPSTPITIVEGLQALERTFSARNVQITCITLQRGSRTVRHIVDETEPIFPRTVQGVYVDTKVTVIVKSPMSAAVNAELQTATSSAAAAASKWIDSTNRMLGSSLSIQQLDEAISRVALSKHIVLITGESGTGKTTAAQLIHDRSKRAGAPFVDVNCAALPEALLESELFGYEKGAFTGATGQKKGLFEVAENGTLFLDEIGELKLELQAKLLKAIEQKKVRRLGGTADIPCYVRILAASSRDLQRMVKAGTFREDLYYRLAILEIDIPPLRHRQEDIRELIAAQLAIEQEENGRFDQPLKLDSRALTELITYSWPGNIRQLFNVLARLACHTPTRAISLAHVRSELARFRKVDPETIVLPEDCNLLLPGESFNEFSDRIHSHVFQTAKEHHNGNMTRVAERLKMDRPNMYQILKRLNARTEKLQAEQSQMKASIAA
jgi:transcriptional regulator with PAS, ATPase and Fis domain